MSTVYRVTIPVKPHIEKFFRVREGFPIRSSDRSIFWLTIRPYLLYKILDDRATQQREQQLTRLKGTLTVELPITKMKVYGLQVRPSDIITINMLLDHYFGKELYWHVKACEHNPGRYKGIKSYIENFCDIYGIVEEVDISMDALSKIYLRQRSIYKRIGTKNVAPAFLPK
jgi:hypothetical protein